MKTHFLMILLSLLNVEAIFSQSCDSTLIPVEDSEYRYQKIENRCEGFYRSPVAAPMINVIGIIQGKLSYSLEQQEIIEIAAPNVDCKNISVRAQAVPLKIYYRMDAFITGNETLKWPVRDILLPNNLTAGKISLMGWYFKDQEKVFVPLHTRSTLDSTVNDNIIRVTFRSTVTVENIQYATYSYQTKTTSDWKDHYIYTCLAGMPINILLAPGNGLHRLTVSAKISGSGDEWLEKQITIDAGDIYK
ncbi:hypothetical protein GF337_01860 [candidate division KSB1 bacterium]|nr:hypothetical protein [candidate division KSB1 bacterium]